MRPIRAHARDVFPLFMKFGGPPKGGGPDPQDPPPPGSAPVSLDPLRKDICGGKAPKEERSPEWHQADLNMSECEGRFDICHPFVMGPLRKKPLLGLLLLH